MDTPDNKKQQQNDNGFNPEFLESMKSLAPDRVARFIELSISDSTNLIAKVEAAIDRQDATEYGEHAHALKSVAGQIGATRLSAIAKELEYMGRDGVLDGVKEKLASIKSEHSVMVEILTKRY